MRRAAIWSAIAVAVVGAVLILVSPWLGPAIWEEARWGIEPPAYIGGLVMSIGLIALAALMWKSAPQEPGAGIRNWSRLTQDYFDTFSHDMGRPLRRILGKEREVRARLEESGEAVPQSVNDLLQEIERQAPGFRLMLANVRVLVELEDPSAPPKHDPLDPAAIVRNVVDRYVMPASERDVEITWWSEPQEFGLIYGDPSAFDHIVTNLVDNAVKYASGHVEVRLTRNASDCVLRVWDDGPGIAQAHRPHVFDRGWTPELAARGEKTSSGLGLFIVRSLTKKGGGEVVVESSSGDRGEPGGSGSHTSFTVTMPVGRQDD